MNRSLAFYFFATVWLALLQPLRADITTNLSAYWPFNQGSGTDATGNGFAATLANTTPVNDRNGSVSSALSFNGTSSSSEVATTFAMKNQQSVAAWIKPSAIGLIYPVLEKAVPGYGGEVDFELFLAPDGRISWNVNTNDGNTGTFTQALSTTILPLNQWTLVLGVIDQASNQVRLYINGTLEGATVMGGRNVRNNNRPLRIGRRIGNQSTQSFNGSIDDIRVYDRALTAADALELFQEKPIYQLTWAEEFSGTTLDPTAWSLLAGNANVSGGIVGLGTIWYWSGYRWFGSMSTDGKKMINSNDFVVEFKARLQGYSDLTFSITDGINSVACMEGDHWANQGLMLTTGGDFGSSVQANNQPTESWKEYRITCLGNQITVQRGDTLGTMNETLTKTLDSTFGSHTLYIVLNNGGQNGTQLDWIRLYQSSPGLTNPTAIYGDGRHGDYTLTASTTIEQLYQAVRRSSDPLLYDPFDPNAVPQFRNLSVSNGAVLSAQPWTGAAGGRVTMKVQGVLEVGLNSIISVSELGDSVGLGRGGNGGTWYNSGYGIGGAYGGGGGGFGEAGGGSGYNWSSGTYVGGLGGVVYGTEHLTSQEMGSGGGASGAANAGGKGGGSIRISSAIIVLNGGISANGASGNYSSAGSGGGSGGAIKLRAVATLQQGGHIQALGGAGGNNGPFTDWTRWGGGGGSGRIRVELSTSTGVTTSPSASVTVDTAADQDGDGIPDFVELGSNPEVVSDSDADGVFDYMEADSDSDGIPDYIERGANGTSPRDSNSDGIPDYTSLDSDADGVLDSIESGPRGIFPKDSDGDGLPDFADTDSDNNGIPDSIELLTSGLTRTADTDGDTIPDYWEQVYGLNPNNATDALNRPVGDQFTYLEKYRLNLRGNTPDFDGDGVSDYTEQLTSGTSATKTDTDGDSMPDAWELAHGLNPLIKDTGGDLDGDGLTNLQEYNGGVASTNPSNRDSDSNGMSDYEQRNGMKFIRHVPDRNDRHLTTFYDNGAWEGWGYDGNGNIIRHVRTMTRDKDSDGLLDAYELANGLDFNSAMGTQGFSGDADSDGWTNHQEYLAGTNPNDSRSHPETVSSAGMSWFNAPKARVITPPGGGAALATINVRVWDAEANPAKLVLQWWDAAASIWKPATLSKVNGTDPSAANALATSIGGTDHQFLWSAISDAPAFNGILLLRVTAQDPAGTTTSEALPFALNTTGPHLVIEEPAGTPLTNGLSTTDFGTVNVGSTLTKTYTLRNVGSAALTSLALNKSGVAAVDYALGSIDSTLAAGASTTVTLGFTPSTGGSRAATLSIASSDTAEGNFIIALTGNGLPLPTPSFITQPQSQIVRVGAPVSFSVANAVGSSPVLAWSKNTTAIPSSNASSYTIAAASLADAATYVVTATNSSTTVTSDVASLAVVSPTAISSKSQNEGTTLTLTCSAAGPGITYVWQRNGTDLGNSARISGANTSTLMITGLNAGDAGSYTCLVKLGALSLSHGSTTLALALKPVVLTTSIPDGQVSESIDFTFTAANNPTSFMVTGLPTGITLEPATGRITGKPTVAKDPYPLTVTAINAVGSSAVVPINWRVLALENQSVGTFNGLVDRDTTLSAPVTSPPGQKLRGHGGSLENLVITSNGTFTGTLKLEDKSYAMPAGSRLETQVGGNPTARIVFKRGTGIADLTMNFTINIGTGELTGTLSDGLVATPVRLQGWRNPWKTTGTTASPANPATALAGTYTAMMDFADGTLEGDAAYPQGHGYGTLTITTAGVATWSGVLADGTVVNRSTTMGPNGEVPLHWLLYTPTVAGTAGSAHGWVRVTAGANAALPDDNLLDTMLDLTQAAQKDQPRFDWMKRPQLSSATTRSYKSGFPLHKLTVTGGGYVKPATNVRVLGLTNANDKGKLTFSSANLETSVTYLNAAPGSGPTASMSGKLFTITSANKAIFLTLPSAAVANPATLALTINAGTGGFNGTFTLKGDPDPTKPGSFVSRTGVTYSGVLVQRLGRGFGCFQLPQLPAVGPPRTTLSTSPQLSGQVLLEAGP